MPRALLNFNGDVVLIDAELMVIGDDKVQITFLNKKDHKYYFADINVEDGRKYSIEEMCIGKVDLSKYVLNIYDEERRTYKNN